MHAKISGSSDLGHLVRRVRESRGWTQRQLADALGSTQRYIYELEAGKPKRADPQFFSIISRLGITLSATTDDS